MNKINPNITEKFLQEELTRKAAEMTSARIAIGLELLKGGTASAALRKAYAKAQGEVADAEAMLAALPSFQSEREVMRRMRAPQPPRVSMDDYGKAMKQFNREYSHLRETPGAVLARGRELVALAKRCGQRALSDVRFRFSNLPGSPELHNL